MNKAYINAEGLKKKYSSTEILRDSLTLLKFKKNNFVRKIFFVLVELLLALIMATQTNTIVLVKEVFGMIVTIIIALLAIVFTGYAFFQALVNDRMLVALLSVDVDNDGNLSRTNKYFVEVMIFQIICVFMDLFVFVIATILPKEWCLLGVELYNEIFAAVIVFIVLHINVEGIWEMKSFIFNVFQLFNLHAYSRMVEIKHQEKGKR